MMPGGGVFLSKSRIGGKMGMRFFAMLALDMIVATIGVLWLAPHLPPKWAYVAGMTATALVLLITIKAIEYANRVQRKRP
jgi:biotin transporter BioY